MRRRLRQLHTKADAQNFANEASETTWFESF